MLVEVNFVNSQELDNQSQIIGRVMGIPIVGRENNTLLIEVEPGENLNEVRALQGVTSVESKL